MLCIVSTVFGSCYVNSMYVCMYVCMYVFYVSLLCFEQAVLYCFDGVSTYVYTYIDAYIHAICIV